MPDLEIEVGDGRDDPEDELARQAKRDAEIIERWNEIRNDPERHTRAVKHIEQEARERQDMVRSQKRLVEKGAANV